MTTVRTATGDDLGFLRDGDRHVRDAALRDALRGGRVLVAEVDGVRVGWLRWGLFWDEIPFLNLLFVLEGLRGRGSGAALVDAWERWARSAGHTTVLTSTLASESAQHFYRRLGYVDTGSLLLPGEATEIVLRKDLVG